MAQNEILEARSPLLSEGHQDAAWVSGLCSLPRWSFVTSGAWRGGLTLLLHLVFSRWPEGLSKVLFTSRFSLSPESQEE